MAKTISRDRGELLIIRIVLQGAAFEDDGEARDREIARLLRSWAKRFEFGEHPRLGYPNGKRFEAVLHDVNGNFCGEVRLVG